MIIKRKLYEINPVLIIFGLVNSNQQTKLFLNLIQDMTLISNITFFLDQFEKEFDQTFAK